MKSSILLISTGQKPCFELVIVAGGSELLFQEHGAPDDLVTLIPGEVRDFDSMPYLFVYHLLELHKDHGSCLIAAIAKRGVDKNLEGKVLEAIVAGL